MGEKKNKSHHFSTLSSVCVFLFILLLLLLIIIIIVSFRFLVVVTLSLFLRIIFSTFDPSKMHGGLISLLYNSQNHKDKKNGKHNKKNWKERRRSFMMNIYIAKQNNCVCERAEKGKKTSDERRGSGRWARYRNGRGYAMRRKCCVCEYLYCKIEQLLILQPSALSFSFCAFLLSSFPLFPFLFSFFFLLISLFLSFLFPPSKLREFGN